MKNLIYIVLFLLVSCEEKTLPTEIWVQQELKNFQAQNNWYDVIEVIKLDSLDFTNGGWSIGNGFYDGNQISHPLSEYCSMDISAARAALHACKPLSRSAFVWGVAHPGECRGCSGLRVRASVAFRKQQ